MVHLSSRWSKVGVVIAGLLVSGSALTLSANAVDSRPQAGPNVADGVFKVRCNHAVTGQFDPIMYPETPAPIGHEHEFFGANAVDESSDWADLNGGESECPSRDEANKSAYWIPGLWIFDTAAGVSGEWRMQEPGFTMNYYRDGGIDVTANPITPFPSPFSMIAGNASGVGQQQSVVQWTCTRGDEPQEDEGFVTLEEALEAVDVRVGEGDAKTCPVDDGEGGSGYTGTLKLRIFFPNCWDGNTGWPWNGRGGPNDWTMSHMTYSDGADGCPNGFPYELPDLMINAHWADVELWDLSISYLDSDVMSEPEGHVMPGGITAHADFMNGWDLEMLARLVDYCLNDQNPCPDNFTPPPLEGSW